jgi:hypothetical protein
MRWFRDVLNHSWSERAEATGNGTRKFHLSAIEVKETNNFDCLCVSHCFMSSQVLAPLPTPPAVPVLPLVLAISQLQLQRFSEQRVVQGKNTYF